MGTGSPVGYADAPGVHHQPSLYQADERHMRMAAHDRLNLSWKIGEHFLPAFDPTVDDNNFAIGTRRGMAEPHSAKTINIESGLFRHVLEETLVGR